MALLRVVHASQLPDPGELARRLQSGEGVASAPVAATAASPAPPAASAEAPSISYPVTFEALVKLVDTASPLLGQQLHDFVGLVRYAPPALVLRPIKPVPGDFARQLAGVLKTATNGSWDVEMSDAPSEPSLLQQEQAAAEAARNEILNAPMVAAVRSVFPNAELIEETRSLS